MPPATLRARILGLSLVVLLGVLLIVPGSLARDNRDATIGLYLTEPGVGCNQIEPLACDDESIVVTGELLTQYYAVLCVFNGDAEKGIAGLTCGVDYDAGANSGVDVFGWTLCADLEFDNGNWPEPGGGNRITWDPVGRCQEEEPGGAGTGVTAVAGYFYISAYSDDRFAVTQNFAVAVPEFKVADCTAAESRLATTQSGWLGFSSSGNEKGELPCLTRETSETTWGDVKNKYGGR